MSSLLRYIHVVLICLAFLIWVFKFKERPTETDTDTMALNVLRVNAPKTATSSIIIMHGLGDSSEGWKFLSDMLHQHETFQSTNFIFPNAPIKPLTIANGGLVSQWFDIFEMGNPNARQDEDGYWNSINKIKNLIDDEINNGIEPSKIIVGGFSQGASLSLGIASTYEKKLGGILCLSGFFNMKKGIKERIVDINKDTDIFHGHGDLDPMININMARDAATYFKGLGFNNYKLKEYHGMGHSTCNEEISDIVEFLSKHI